MSNCIFCKIINDEIPSYKIYGDEKIYTSLDITQMARRHILMIPEQHVTDIFGHSDISVSDIFARIPKVARALEKVLPKMEGLNTLNNNEEMVYQSVLHSHVHLIPRYSKEDDFSVHLGNHQEDYSAEAVQEIVEAIVKQAN